MLPAIFIVFLCILKCVIGREKFVTGEEAEALCEAYKKVCPIGKVCVVQNLYWPRQMSFPVCVHARDVPAKAKICELPPSPGGCGAQFNRWYYNVHTKECSPLTYSGCEGNLNNFHTKKKCEKTCEVKPTEKPEVSAPSIVKLGITSRTPDVLAAPAPLRLESSNDERQALELKDDLEVEQGSGKGLPRRKNRRRGGRGSRGGKGGRPGRRNRNPNNKRRRRRRHRKNRLGSGLRRRYGELRGRKTTFMLSPPIQNDHGAFLLRQLRRKQQILANNRRYNGYGGYYNKIKLFSLLGAKNRKNSASDE